MTRIFRATTDLVARKGACFAEIESDARAYLDNPGFGGPTLAAYDVDGDVFDAEDLSFQAIAEEYMDLLTDGERAALEVAEIDVLTIRDDLGSYGGMVFHALEGHRGYRDPWREGRDAPGLRDVLARRYAWVRYTDDYPVGCITRVYLGAADLHPSEVL